MKITKPLTSTVVVGGLLALSLAGLTACSTGATRDADTGEVTEAGQSDVFSVKVGDCFDDEGFSDPEVSELPLIPCDRAHDNEIYHVFDLEDGDFPGVDEVETLADEGCLAEFEGFIGLPFEESDVYYSYICPTEDSWAMGDREIACLVFQNDKTTGSLAGAAH